MNRMESSNDDDPSFWMIPSLLPSKKSSSCDKLGISIAHATLPTILNRSFSQISNTSLFLNNDLQVGMVIED